MQVNSGDTLLIENENICVWVMCPNCGWIIPAERILYAKVDLNCFECGKRNISEFELVVGNNEPVVNEFEE